MLSYTPAILGVVDGSIDVVADTLKLLLLSAAYTPDKDHGFVADVVAAELACTGYVGGYGGAGRKTITTPALSADLTNDWVVLDCDSLTYTAINGATARYAVLHKPVTSDADSPVLNCIDINPTAGVTFDGNDWTLDLTNGVWRFYSA